jgi:3'(2'), 5'-bisphosphate nucleotidase
MTPAQLTTLLPRLEDIARRAGDAILDIYHSDFTVRHKEDSSPLTEADERAEAIIVSGLEALTPGIPIVAEEAAAAGRIPDIAGGTFWLVDPLDGTKEFVKRNGEFTVNIGLVADGVPVAGVVRAPALGEMWSGAAGKASRIDGESRRSIICRRPPSLGAVILTSRSHRNPEALDAWIAAFPGASLGFAGSSLKFCRVAEGSADFYPRFGPTSEWDTAAAHAVLLAAGGSVETFEGKPLAYAKPQFLNPDFIASGRPPQ